MTHMYSMAGWKRIPCAEREEHFALADATGGIEPVSGLTDLDGTYGTPIVFTEWARKDSSESLLRDYRWPDSERKCEHYFWVGTPVTPVQEGNE